ncbi:hypothetical protein C4568_00515 [Candidatus Parcubacteria bacterium]|nr:MAG: hypothetical protein C4568_00515 [Candidatus Parcubacteria bacterium]
MEILGAAYQRPFLFSGKENRCRYAQRLAKGSASPYDAFMDIGEALREELASMADSGIYARGRRYAQSGKVRSVKERTEGDEVSVEATVRGSQAYKTEMSYDARSGVITAYECTCPYDGDLCKHVVALGLAYADAVDARGAPDFHTIDEIADMRAKLKAAGIPAAHIPEALLAQLAAAVRMREAHPSPASTWHHERGVWTPTDAAPPSNPKPAKKPKARKPFRDRYDLCISTRYDGSLENIGIYERESSSYYHAFESPEDSHKLLKRELHLIDPERAVLEMLADAPARQRGKDDRLDYPRIVQAARDAGMRIMYKHLYKKEPLTFLRQPSKPKAVLALKHRSSYVGAVNTKHEYHTIELALPGFKNSEKIAARAGENSVLIIEAGEAAIYPMPQLLGRIVARAMHEVYDYPYTSRRSNESQAATAELTVDEYKRADDIAALCRQYLDATIDLPQGLTVQHHEPKALIVVDYSERERRLGILPSVDYGGAVLPVCATMQYSEKAEGQMRRRQERSFGTAHVVRIDSGTVHIAPVAEKLERELFALGLKQGERLGIARIGRATVRGGQVANFIERYMPEIRKLPYELRFVRDQVPEITSASFSAEFDIDFKGENDWLAFDLGLYCGSERITLADVEAFLETGGDILKTSDGRSFKIENPAAIERLMRLLEHFRKNDDGSFEGRAYHAPALAADAVGSSHYRTRLSKSMQSFLKEARSGKAVKRIRIPAPFKDVLRDYQKDGVEWMTFLRRYRFGGILADDMGTGKTLQTLATLSAHRADDTPSLVVAPKTLLHNWAQEAARFAPHLKVGVVSGSPAERAEMLAQAGEYDLLVTSYPLLQKDLARYEAVPFNYCVLDEAQYIKNPRSKSAHAVKKVRSEYRLALTGTPLENSVEELWSIFDFLMPDFLGRHARFQERYGVPIMKRGDAAQLEELRRRVSSFMLRRAKEDVLKELPQKIEQTIECTLSDEQNILYQDVLRRVRSDIFGQVKKKGFAAAQIHILAGLTKLRQICNHPALVLPKKRDAYPSAKLEVCMNLVNQLRSEGRKALIFSQFTQMLDLIAAELKRQGINYSYLSGATSAAQRPRIIESFISDLQQTAFLISTKAGGVGLNLIAADAVIIFDPWWNPQVERQAIDRAHRIGQTKSVNVYRLRAKGTIEEKIAALQARKQGLFSALVGESGNAFKKLTWDDVRGLLSAD